MIYTQYNILRRYLYPLVSFVEERRNILKTILKTTLVCLYHLKSMINRVKPYLWFALTRIQCYIISNTSILKYQQSQPNMLIWSIKNSLDTREARQWWVSLFCDNNIKYYRTAIESWHVDLSHISFSSMVSLIGKCCGLVFVTLLKLIYINSINLDRRTNLGIRIQQYSLCENDLQRWTWWLYNVSWGSYVTAGIGFTLSRILFAANH